MKDLGHYRSYYLVLIITDRPPIESNNTELKQRKNKRITSVLAMSFNYKKYHYNLVYNVN